MKVQETIKPETRVESIRLTQYAKNLISRKTTTPSPREYTTKDLIEIADKNDTAIAQGKFKTWPEILAKIGEKYGLSI